MVFNLTLSSMQRTLWSSRTGATFVEMVLMVAEGEAEGKVVVEAEVVAVLQLVLKDQMIEREMLESASLIMGSGQEMAVHRV